MLIYQHLSIKKTLSLKKNSFLSCTNAYSIHKCKGTFLGPVQMGPTSHKDSRANVRNLNTSEEHSPHRTRCPIETFGGWNVAVLGPNM